MLRIEHLRGDKGGCNFRRLECFAVDCTHLQAIGGEGKAGGELLMFTEVDGKGVLCLGGLIKYKEMHSMFVYLNLMERKYVGCFPAFLNQRP